MDDLQLSKEEASIILDGEIGTSDLQQRNSHPPRQGNEGRNSLSTQHAQQQQEQQQQVQLPDPSGGNSDAIIGATSLNQPQSQHQQQRAMQNAPVPLQQPHCPPYMFGRPTSLNPYGVGGHQVTYGSHPSQWAPPGPTQAIARTPQPPQHVAAFPQPGQQRQPMYPQPQPGMQVQFKPYTMAQGRPAGMGQTPWPNPHPQHQQQGYRPPNAPMAVPGASNIPRAGMFVGGSNFVQNGQTFGAMARMEPWKHTNGPSNFQGTASEPIHRKRPAAKSLIRKRIPPGAMKTFHATKSKKEQEQHAKAKRASSQALPPAKRPRPTRPVAKRGEHPRPMANEVYSGLPDDPMPGGWPPGWIKKKVLRTAGTMKGKADSYWYTPKLRFKLRSFGKVKRFIEALSQCNGDEDKAFTMIGRKG